MRRLLWMAGLTLLLAAPAWAADRTDGEHGTALHFAKDPSAAAKQAQKEEKLVFILHLSGLFEDPGCT